MLRARQVVRRRLTDSAEQAEEVVAGAAWLKFCCQTVKTED